MSARPSAPCSSLQSLTAAPKRPASLVGARARPVGDRSGSAPCAAQRARRQLGHLPRADHQHLALRRSRRTPGARARSPPSSTETGLRAIAVSRRTRRATRNAPWKQALSIGAGAAVADGALVRLLHLPQDLRLAQDQRIEAAGDAEEVRARPRRRAVHKGGRRAPARSRRRAGPAPPPAPARRGRRLGRWPRRSRPGCRSTAAPPRAPRGAPPARRATLSISSGTTASRSRTPTGAVLCETPRTRRSMAAPPMTQAAWRRK